MFIPINTGTNTLIINLAIIALNILDVFTTN